MDMKYLTQLLCSLLVFLIAGNLSLLGQDNTNPAPPNPPEITNFQVSDGCVKFTAYSMSPPPFDSGHVHSQAQTIPGLNELAYSLAIFPGPLRPIYGKFSPNDDSLLFMFKLPPGIFPGLNRFIVTYGKDTIFNEHMQVMSNNSAAGQQPLIESITPRGTRPGRSITLKGQNFGDDLNNIYIWYTNKNDLPLNYSLEPGTPTYLTSPDASGVQTLRFSVPDQTEWDQNIDNIRDSDLLEHELRIRVVVKGQPSANGVTVSIVKPYFRARILLFLGIIIAFFVLLVWFLVWRMRKRGKPIHLTFKSLIVDPASNRYSLARIQALAWTLMLVISYTYFVVMTFLILDQSVIPDFDPSLLILMGISTGGLLIAGTQDRAKPDAMVAKAAAPSLSDLIMENGRVSMASLQLLLFTMVGLGIYMVYMSSPDLVETGLPTMPDTLLALMGISQGGYLTGKAVENSGQGNTVQNQPVNAAANTVVTTSVPTQPVANVPVTPTVTTTVTTPPAVKSSPPAAEMSAPTAEVTPPPVNPETPPAEGPPNAVG
jgi:hypothetical protein